MSELRPVLADLMLFVSQATVLLRQVRPEKGSKNREKARAKVATQHRKVANTRKDVHHKIAQQLLDNTQAFAVEDINITGMVMNRRLAKAIIDAG